MEGIIASFIDDTSIYARLTGDGSIEAKLSDDNEIIKGTITNYTIAPIYDGDYIVTPRAHEEVILETSDKLLTDDVTILKIPYFETHNDYGETIYIGSEI